MSTLQKGVWVIHLKKRDGFTMMEGFKKLIMCGSVVELAVTVVTADIFSPIVNNLVGKVINPTIGGLLGKSNFNNIGESHVGDATVQPGTVLIALIASSFIAAAVYPALVFLMNKLNERMAKWKGLNAEEAEVNDEVRLLTEIRDALAGGGYINGGGAAGGGYTGGGYRQ